MKRLISLLLVVIICLPTFALAEETAAETWRSVLYPENWEPGYTTEDGMFLQDYSYAGYRMGEKDLPEQVPGLVYDVTDYGADPTGENYSTEAIQAAIDAAIAAGGGTVYIPEGIFKVRPAVKDTKYVFKINSSNILIKGAGIDKTKIYNDEPYMRFVSIFWFCPDGFEEWQLVEETDYSLLREDVTEGTFVLPVESVDGYNVGDWIMVRNDMTSAFIAEHNQTGRWTSSLQPVMYYRQITKVDSDMNTVTIDIPTRYILKTRDNARISKLAIPHLSEVGIQDMSFGMLENLTAGLDEEEYKTEGTAAYEVHQAVYVKMLHVVDGWVKNLGSFRPEQNTKDVHTLSGGIYLHFTRGITVTDCSMQLPLYEGGGGNGYLYNLKGQECLVKNCYGYHGRHNYSFGGLYCSGNVLTSSTTSKAARETDMHMHLCHANLLDNMTVSGDQLEAINRNSYGSTNKHGHSATQVVFWNTYGKGYQSGESSIVETQQYGMGYAIGTRGTATAIKAYEGDNTSPMDFVEGEGMSDTLVPQSLYEDQFAKRLERMGAPVIEKTVPANGGKLYKKSAAKVIFESAMDKDSVENKENVAVTPDANYNLSYDATDKTLTVSFPDGMEEGTEYTITFREGGIMSEEETTLLNNKSISFTAVGKATEVEDIRLFVGDGFAYAGTKITNVSSQPINAALILGLYQGEKLLDIKVTPKTGIPGLLVDIDTEQLVVAEGIEDYYYKAFLWNSDTLTELSPSVYKAGDDLSSATLIAVADAHVRNGGSYNNINYGKETALGIKYGSSGYQRKAYLKFDLTEQKGTVKKATLRLYGYGSGAISSTIKIKTLSDNTWLEDTITWNTSPAMDTQLGTMSYTGEGAYCELDVTDYINQNMGAVLSFGIDTSSKDFLNISSREAEENNPQLVLEY